MARVRSTARVTREGEETKAIETAPISKVMRQSGLVVTEGIVDEGTSAAEAKQADIEDGKIMATAACLACPEGRPAPGGGTGIPPGLTG